jgi:molecular chaperone DnaK
VEKALKDAGDKVSDDQKKTATDAVAALKSAMSSDDRDDIDSKTTALEQASSAIMQKMYEPSAGAGASSPGADAGSAGQQAPKEDVLDAEFEEVKDSDRKKA